MRIQIEIMHDCKGGVPMAIVNFLLDIVKMAGKIEDIRNLQIKVIEE